MPVYPNILSIPSTGLVPPHDQPTYLELDQTSTPDQMNLCLEMLDRHVERGWAERPAIFFAETRETITFGELTRRTAELAGGLKSLRLQIGDRVAVLFPNRPDGVIAMLAAWRAGGAVVPVPPQARAAELPDYIADTGSRFLVMQESDTNITEVAKASAELGVEQVIIGPGQASTGFLSWRELVATSTPLTTPTLVPADMPSVFWHTGGTTGKPKCCYHTARQYVLGGKAAGQAFAADPDTDVHLAFPGPLGHAAGMIGRTNVSLLNGVPYVEVEQFTDPGALLRALSEFRVTWMIAIAITWARILKQYRENPSTYDLSALKKAYGPMMSVVAEDVYDGWVELGHPVRNLMGSTQFATWFLVPPTDRVTAAGCVGYPSPGYQAKVIDLHQPGFVEVATGDIGSLAVRGPSGLTYWNRAELQARDVRNGWTIMDDLAKIDDDGTVWYLGRSDFMINSTQFKIAPVEVEEAVGRHPDVAEVAVVGSPHPERGEVVTAFIVPVEGRTADDDLIEDIQGFVKKEISPYKYPRRIAFTPALPRDPVGKVQVRELRDLAREIFS